MSSAPPTAVGITPAPPQFLDLHPVSASSMRRSTRSTPNVEHATLDVHTSAHKSDEWIQRVSQAAGDAFLQLVVLVATTLGATDAVGAMGSIADVLLTTPESLRQQIYYMVHAKYLYAGTAFSEGVFADSRMSAHTRHSPATYPVSSHHDPFTGRS